MILVIADCNPPITQALLPGKEQKVAYIYMDSPSFSAFLDAALKQEDLELAVIECHFKETACLSLISAVKKQRMDVPVLFFTSMETDHTIAEAFKRGVRDCFRGPFDILLFKERIRKIRSFRKARRELREPLMAPEDRNGDSRLLAGSLPDGIVKALSFIEDHVSDRDLTVERLARIAGMSTYHFCRNFKKHTTFTPMRYLARMRVDRAKKMMKCRAGSMTISQIAMAAGFYDSSHLNRHFKKMTGLTPKAFIRAPRPVAGR